LFLVSVFDCLSFCDCLLLERSNSVWRLAVCHLPELRNMLLHRSNIFFH